MFYAESKTHEMTHFTFINNHKVLESVASFVNASNKYNTKFQAGVFRLTNGDSISVSGVSKKKYRMKPETTFFGAFLLFPN